MHSSIQKEDNITLNNGKCQVFAFKMQGKKTRLNILVCQVSYVNFTLTVNLLTIVYSRHRPHNIVEHSNQDFSKHTNAKCQEATQLISHWTYVTYIGLVIR